MSDLILKKDDKELLVKFIKTKNKSSYFKVEKGYILAKLGKYHSLDFAKSYLLKKFDKFYNMILLNLKNLEDDDAFLIFGKSYKISFLKTKSLYLLDDINLVIYINIRYKDKSLENVKRKIAIDLLSKKVLEFNVLYKERLNSLNIKIVPVCFKKLKTKYGYCNYLEGYICISLFMIKLEKENLFHLLFHEYSHFIFQNHSKDFYNLLEKLDPNYKENDKRLKKNHIVY